MGMRRREERPEDEEELDPYIIQPPAAPKKSPLKIGKYHYDAIVREIYDGDTVTVDIDMGLNLWVHEENLRLDRIDAPEVRGETREEGLVSRNVLRSWILGKEVEIKTVKDKTGKYGRYMVEIWYEDATGNVINVNDQMVETGHAVYRDY